MINLPMDELAVLRFVPRAPLRCIWDGIKFNLKNDAAVIPAQAGIHLLDGV